MKRKKKTLLNKKSIWLKDPKEHDFPAAQDYLELLFIPKMQNNIFATLKNKKPS